MCVCVCGSGSGQTCRLLRLADRLIRLAVVRRTMTSAVFFLDLKGKTLLARNYRGDIPMSAVEKFMPLLLDAEEENAASPPCISHEGVNVLPPLTLCKPLLILVSLYST